MASGTLGKADLVAATATLLYTVPAGVTATINVRFANRTATGIAVRIAIGTGAAPALADYMSYDIGLPANGVVEDTGIVCSAGDKVWAVAAVAGVSVRVHGFEG